MADFVKDIEKLSINDLGLELEVPEKEDMEAEWEDRKVTVSDSQYEVIKHPFKMNELLSIRAGPGLGKTFTLMARIARLLGEELRPSEILVLSMANRSVNALQKHLETLVGPEITECVEISTFHSFCGSVVDQYALIGDPNMHKRRLLDLIGWRNVAEFFISKSVLLNGHTIGTTISAAKFDKILSDIADGKMTSDEAQSKFDVLAKYIDGLFEYMKKLGMMRYNDLVTSALEIIQKSQQLGTVESLLPRIASYKMIVVDEFQDMYPLLLSVVKAVSEYPTYEFDRKVCKNLVIAGDQNQSIYEFLGSSPESMNELQSQLSLIDVVELPLNDSFRCTQEILDASVGVCFNKDNEGANRLKSQRNSRALSYPVLLDDYRTDEFTTVADEIVRLICYLGGLINPRDIAVLTKSNAEAVKIQLLLRKAYGIECTKISLGNTWVSSRIRVFRDILSVVLGEADASFSLFHILHILDTSKGATQRTSKLFSRAIAAEESDRHTFLEDYIYDNLESGKNFNKLYEKLYISLKNIAAFINQVQKEREIFHAVTSENLIHSPLAIVECLQRVSALNGLSEYVNGPDKVPTRELLTSFNDSLHYCFEKYMSHKDYQDRSFIEYFLQNYDQEIPPHNENLVQVLTIHSAKGLEFPVVFVLAGMGNGWQSLLRGQDEKNTNQSRLLYVACTRARDLLYLSNPTVELNDRAKKLFTTALPPLDPKPPKIAETGIQNLKVKPNITGHTSFGNKASILLYLLADLNRPEPSAERLERGREYYRIFQQRRLYHSSPFNDLPLKALSSSTRFFLKSLKH